MHASSSVLLESFIAKQKHHAGLTVADVGCYDEALTYKEIVERYGHHYIGIDCRAGKNVDFVTDTDFEWKNVPKETFDIVITGQTLEHIAQPWVWICRLASLLKPGGLVWICAPNTWEFHEVPIDCWRVWPDGMKALLKWGGFEVVEVGKEGADTWGVGKLTDA
jgi:2-polyprenyl-3-methyl-5-hydroxy-6-metoxy-1,4-benzoquinol methylase